MLNWQELPLVRFLLPFVAGILLALHFNYSFPFLFWLIPSMAAIIFFISLKKGLFKHRWLFGFGLSFFFILIGYQLSWHHNDLNKALHFKEKMNESSFVIGIVDEVPRSKERIKVLLKSQSIGNTSDSLSECIGKILCYIDKDSLSEQIAYGDRILIKGNIFEIESPKNPEAFNFKQYSSLKNIHYQTFLKVNDWKPIDINKGNYILSQALVLRTKFIQILKKHLPGENEFSVASALVLGYKDEISEEIRTAYVNTGAMHVLAVSGLHVGLIYFILNFFLKWGRWKSQVWKIGKVLILVSSIWAFAVLTGLSPSVQRAAAMFTFISIAKSFYRHTNIYNTLAASAFFLLIFNPFLIMNVGFQLSYLAVIGIVFFQPRIVKRWFIKNKIGNHLWQLTGVSISAQIMTLPISLFYFHQFPIYFWLSGLVVVPAAGLILGLGLLLFLLESTLPGISTLAGAALFEIIHLVNWIIFNIQHFPGSVIEGIWIGFIMAILLYLVIGKLMIALNTYSVRWVDSALGLVVVASISLAFSKIEIQKNRQIVIYSIYKNTGIDFIDGKKAFSLRNPEISEASLSFAAQNYRWSKGIKEIIPINFEQVKSKEEECFFMKDNFIQFYDKKMAVLEKHIKIHSSTKMIVDYLLIRNNPKISIEELTQSFQFHTIIFDASNSKWKVEKWKEYCKKRQIPFYDINEKGSLIIDL